MEIQANRSSRFVAFGVAVHTAGQDEILKRMRFAIARYEMTGKEWLLNGTTECFRHILQIATCIPRGLHYKIYW